jgi:DNA polymerase-3 subunit delta
VFYVFHGNDEFGLNEELARLRGKLAGGDRAMAELNTSILDSNRLTMAELRHACDAVPFLADRRLVISRGLLGRLTQGRKDGGTRESEDGLPTREQAFLDELVEYLPSLPPTTRLIFVEYAPLKASHPVLELARVEGKHKRAFVRSFKLPTEWELPNWILRRAKARGGSIDSRSASLLAELLGSDLRLLDQELDKLLIYADGQRITTEDVQLLVNRARETSIFELVDCVGRRETGRALQLLHSLLEDGQPPLYLLTMLARQIRILIQVSELLGQRLTLDEMVDRLKLHRFVVEKASTQARNFDTEQLESAHQRLVETDKALKTGDLEDLLALDLLVVDLTHA